jgi:hypothetical protein
MSKQAIMGGDLKDHSDKDCCCGGHSHHDHKKSRTHHSTLARLQVRRAQSYEKD